MPRSASPCAASGSTPGNQPQAATHHPPTPTCACAAGTLGTTSRVPVIRSLRLDQGQGQGGAHQPCNSLLCTHLLATDSLKVANGTFGTHCAPLTVGEFWRRCHPPDAAPPTVIAPTWCPSATAFGVRREKCGEAPTGCACLTCPPSLGSALESCRQTCAKAPAWVLLRWAAAASGLLFCRGARPAPPRPQSGTPAGPGSASTPPRVGGGLAPPRPFTPPLGPGQLGGGGRRRSAASRALCPRSVRPGHLDAWSGDISGSQASQDRDGQFPGGKGPDFLPTLALTPWGCCAHWQLPWGGVGASRGPPTVRPGEVREEQSAGRELGGGRAGRSAGTCQAEPATLPTPQPLHRPFSPATRSTDSSPAATPPDAGAWGRLTAPAARRAGEAGGARIPGPAGGVRGASPAPAMTNSLRTWPGGSAFAPWAWSPGLRPRGPRSSAGSGLWRRGSFCGPSIALARDWVSGGLGARSRASPPFARVERASLGTRSSNPAHIGNDFRRAGGGGVWKGS